MNVSIDGSFNTVDSWLEVYIQDNGTCNDQIVVIGPAGKEEIWVNLMSPRNGNFGPILNSLSILYLQWWLGQLINWHKGLDKAP